MMASPLSCAVKEKWLIDGTTETVSLSMQQESDRRVGLARALLGITVREPGQQGHPIWLPTLVRRPWRFPRIWESTVTNGRSFGQPFDQLKNPRPILVSKVLQTLA